MLEVIGSTFHNLLFVPIVNLLVVLYHGLNFLHLPYALGFAIIALTVVIRLIMYPLTKTQLSAAKNMQAVAPHLKKLKEKYKNDAKMMQSETMRIYKEHGVNPAAGCLPVLIQLPLIWALYSVLQLIVKTDPKTLKEINDMLYTSSLKLTHVWDPNFFGLPLAQNPSQLMSTIGPIILLVPILTGVFQFIQSKMMMQPADATGKELAIKGNKVKEKKDEDFATAFQSQSLFIFPVMIGFFSFNFPIGLSLYWNTFTIFGIIQQYQVSGLGGLKDLINKIYGKK